MFTVVQRRDSDRLAGEKFERKDGPQQKFELWPLSEEVLLASMEIGPTLVVWKAAM